MNACWTSGAPSNTEVVSLLGVSVGFSDTDGDSMR